MKARDGSLWAKIIALAVVLIGAVLKWVGLFTSCTISELCTVGFTIVGLFGTVDINLMLEKIFTGKSNRNLQ